MDDLHIRLPSQLKHDFRESCARKNLSMTSALIFMMNREMKEGFLVDEKHYLSQETELLGFFLT
ncbi:hypothetical protein SAMN05660710_00804 [Paracoccus tibetensis]|uniref:Uncharacterized protein n=1 Tax=Paracoccus tibetensis TaxID=336292 RepID=A0A1G5DGV7_9RHOB|nr:hypothetical protein SAMN05660710_00804 [Paracoccus tibetensis]